MDEPKQEQQVKRRRRGCFFYAAIAIFFFLLLIVLAFLSQLKLFTNLTDKQPVPVPTVKMSQAEIDQVRQRVDAFRQAVRAGQSPAPLILSADEINALLISDPDLEPLKGKLYVVKIEGNTIRAQTSVPMSQLGLTKFQDRYFNGFATFELSLRNGTLRLKPQELVSLKGKALPPEDIALAKNQNFAKNLNSNPRVSVALDWLESIEVKDGKLVITPKAKP